MDSSSATVQSGGAKPRAQRAHVVGVLPDSHDVKVRLADELEERVWSLEAGDDCVAASRPASLHDPGDAIAYGEVSLFNEEDQIPVGFGDLGRTGFDLDGDGAISAGSKELNLILLPIRIELTVFNDSGDRGFTLDQDTINAWLEKGRNKLLVKVLNSGGGWELCVRITDRQNRPIELTASSSQ